MKLIEDKVDHQHSAKEALRRVYLERCEAMQKLSKSETDFMMSENECKILRDRLTWTEKCFHDVSERLRLLESECNEYISEEERQQIQAKMEFEKSMRELAEKLEQSEAECESLQHLLQQKSTKSNGDEDKLQKQAFENVSTLIASKNIGDNENEHEEYIIDEDVAAALRRENKNDSKSGEDYDFHGSDDSSSSEKQGNFKLKTSSNQTAGEEAKIIKWLKDVDFTMKESSMDINDISSNESDSSDENDGIFRDAIAISVKELKQRCSKLEKKLQNLCQHIKKLESDINQYPVNKMPLMNIVDSDDIVSHSEAVTFGEFNGQMTKDLHSIQLKKTVFTLFEAYEQIFDNFKQLRAVVTLKQKQSQDSVNSLDLTTTTATQFQNIISIEKSNTNVLLPEIDEVDDSEEDDENVEILTTGQRVNSLKQFSKQSTVLNTEEISNATKAAFLVEIEDLKNKLSDQDRDSQQRLEMLQIECETYKMKVNELLKMTDSLRQIQECEENQSYGDGVSIDSGVGNVETTETTALAVTDVSVNTSMDRSISDDENSDVELERQMREELETLNGSVVQYEKELLAYKESLEQFQNENLQLRKELFLTLLRTIFPIGIAVFGVLAYLIITYVL